MVLGLCGGVGGFVPAAGTPAVSGLAFFERIAGGERQALHNFSFVVGEVGPGFHPPFIAARTSLCGLHVK